MALYKYTPGLADPEVLRKTIVGREEQLKTIDRILKNASSGRSLSHALLIGPRGIGKTHLLRIVYHTVRGDIDLQPLGRYGDHFVPVIFPEEEYINSLEKFLARAVKYLGNEMAPGIQPVSGSFGQSAGEVRREHLIAFFKDYKRKFSKIILLLIDNADDIIEGFTEEDQAALRDLLMTSDSVFFIGTAPTLFDAVVDHERPLYNFFELIWLKEISFFDMGALLQKFAEIEGKQELLSAFQKSEAKLRAIHSLSGGNPRLILSLYQIMAEGNITGVEGTFIRLIDDFSPLFREKMKDLSRQQREIIDVMAQATQLLTPTEIAASCNMPVNVVNAQIKRMEKAGYVKKVDTGRGKKAIYEIREKLFCLWRQMRVEAGRKRLGFIVKFYEIWYSKEDLEEQLNKITSDLTTVLSREEPAIQAYKDKLWYIAEALGKPEISARVEADLSYFKGDYDLSVKSLLKYLNVQQHDEGAWNNLGIAYGRLERYEDAISAYKKALEIKPDKHEAWNNLGSTFAKLKKYDEAIEAYVKAMEINPEDPDAWQNLCAVHLISFGKDTLAKRGNFDSTKLRQALECLPHIKERKEIYETFGAISRFLLKKKKIEGIKGILTEVERTGHEDLLEFLTPYSTLVKYIDTKDRQVIDRLRSEERIIVEEMLQTL